MEEDFSATGTEGQLVLHCAQAILSSIKMLEQVFRWTTVCLSANLSSYNSVTARAEAIDCLTSHGEYTCLSRF